MSGSTERNLARGAAAASLLVLVALFWPAVQRRMFVYGDLGSFFLPVRVFLADNLARGITPLWMPNLFCGFYAHGEGQIGIFHPVRWLLYRFLPVPEAFNLECLLPYPLALVGVALFMRRLALPASAAIFGGATFAFSAYLTARLTHVNVVAVIAHLGWLLWAIDILLRESGRRRWRAWVGIALVTGSQLLIGNPVAIPYCWLIALPYALYVAASRRQLAPLLVLASAIAVGVLIGGIQLVPTLDYLATTGRAQPTYAYLTGGSLHPSNLLTIVAPWLFHHRLYMDRFYNPIEEVLYQGPLVPIAALWVWLRRRELGPWRPLAAGLAGLSALALILALGSHTPLYRYFLAIPVVGLLRIPARYTLVLYFAGAILSAIAWADLQRGAPSELRRRARWVWLVPAASWLVAGAALAMRSPGRGPAWLAEQISGPGPLAIGPLLFTLAAALFALAASGRRAALYALCTLALADQAIYAATLWWSDPPRTLEEFRAAVAPPPVAAPLRIDDTPQNFGFFFTPEGRGRWWSPTAWIVHDARLVSGYVGLPPAAQLDYSRPVTLRLASAAAQVDGRSFTRPLSGALPRARLVASALQRPNPNDYLDGIDVEQTALVDERIDLEPGPAGDAAIEEDLPGAIRIAVHAPTRQLLVISESVHAGWRAEVDDATARALRVNGDFLGVLVGAGAHEVQLRFAPRSFTVGCWTSLAGVAIALAVALAGLAGFARSR